MCPPGYLETRSVQFPPSIANTSALRFFKTWIESVRKDIERCVLMSCGRELFMYVFLFHSFLYVFYVLIYVSIHLFLPLLRDHRCFGILKGRFRCLRIGLRFHDAETNHQTFVVCAMLHNAILRHRKQAAAGEYDLNNVARFGTHVGDFEPYGPDERDCLHAHSNEQVARVTGRAGHLELHPLLTFADDEKQQRDAFAAAAERAGGRADAVRGGVDGGPSGTSDDDDDDDDDGAAAARAQAVKRGTVEDRRAHFELREKLATHIWYLKTHNMLDWDSGCSPLANVGYDVGVEVSRMMRELLEEDDEPEL